VPNSAAADDYNSLEAVKACSAAGITYASKFTVLTNYFHHSSNESKKKKHLRCEIVYFAVYLNL